MEKMKMFIQQSHMNHNKEDIPQSYGPRDYQPVQSMHHQNRKCTGGAKLSDRCKSHH